MRACRSATARAPAARKTHMTDIRDHDHHLSCEQVLEQLFAYLDQALDATTNADVERHLQSCRGCFSRAEFERRLRARVAETGAVSAPETLRVRIKALTDRF